MITVSIVTFRNDKNGSKSKNKFEILKNSIHYLCKIVAVKKILIIDNSPNPYFSSLSEINNKIVYKYLNGKNLCYGGAHNLSRKFLNLEKYHIVLNPDIVFYENNVLVNLIEFMEKNTYMTRTYTCRFTLFYLTYLEGEKIL